ncbi:MAG TPA: indole-3-glycerol-phosphate synthase, partial [Limnochordales bacterium]
MEELFHPKLRGHLLTIAQRRLAWVTGSGGQAALDQLQRQAASSPEVAGARSGPGGFVEALRRAREAWAAQAGLASGQEGGRRPRPAPDGPLEGAVPVIAEVKRRSPSAGAIRPEADAAGQARLYRQAGACCLSVLAEEEFFGGSPQDVCRAVQASGLPVLFKDVVVHPLQLELACAAGARAVLLIAAVLSPQALVRLAGQARRLGLEVLVEVHDEQELSAALAAEPDLVGINNRDLTTFQVDPARVARLLPAVPARVPVVAESGYRRPQEVRQALAQGAVGVLVGEALMRCSDPRAFLRAVMTGQPETEGVDAAAAS